MEVSYAINTFNSTETERKGSRDFYQTWPDNGFAVSIIPRMTRRSSNEKPRIMLPKEWTSVMRPLQDQCEPTRYEDVENLFLTDMGSPISEIFDDFDPQPIGVASLAKVHVGRHRESGKLVAVKVHISIHLAYFLMFFIIHISYNIHILQNSVTLTWKP
jgi:hypothetical protein